MTSYILAAHEDRPIPSEWKDPDCIFCKIVAGKAKSFKVFETEETLAFLDKMPLRRGHVLLIPKIHCSRISDLPEYIGAALGKALPRVTKALSLALENPDLNVVLNQGYAQAVNHAHFHLIPAPLASPPSPPPSASNPTSLLDSLDSVSFTSSSSPPSHLTQPSPKSSQKATRVSSSLLRTPSSIRTNPPTHQEMIDGEQSFRLPGTLREQEGEEVAGLIRARL